MSTGVLPAASAPPAAQLLAHASSPIDAHLTYQTHYWAEGPLAAGGGYVKKLWSGAGELVLKPKLMASLRETNTFCYSLCPLSADRLNPCASRSLFLLASMPDR